MIFEEWLYTRPWVISGSFPHALRGGGVSTPKFRTTPPGFRGRKEGKRGRGGRGKGERRRKRRDPQGLVDIPSCNVPNLKNTLGNLALVAAMVGSRRTTTYGQRSFSVSGPSL